MSPFLDSDFTCSLKGAGRWVQRGGNTCYLDPPNSSAPSREKPKKQPYLGDADGDSMPPWDHKVAL